MNTERSDFDRALREWFSDGPTSMPERVVDVVAGRIDRQPQRRTWRLRGRPFMNTYAKVALAAAAVIVVAVVGYSILPRTAIPEPGGVPSPSALPTAAATVAPTASSSTLSGYPIDKLLTAGSHTTRLFKPAFTFTVPEGWINDGDAAEGGSSIGIYSLFPDTPANRAEFARTGNTVNGILAAMLPSPYFFCESVEDNRGATAAEKIAALMANEAIATSGLVDVSIGGLTGKQVDLRLNPDWTGTCPAGPGDPSRLELEDDRIRVIFLDVPGQGVLTMFVGSGHAADFDAFIADAMPIIQSFEFDLGQ